MAYYKQGARAEALAEWKQVLSILAQQVNSARVPESFWTDFARACDHLRTRRLFNDLKPDVDALLRAYLQRNGNYRSNALLHNAYVAIDDPVAGTAWLLDIATAAHDPSAVLADVVEASWIPLAQRAPIYQRILEAKQEAVLKADGIEKENARQVLRSWQVRWIKYLVATRQYPLAGDAIASLSNETRTLEAAAVVPLELQVAVQVGSLDSKIDGYRADPQTAPASDVMRAAARQLFDAGDKQSARKVLEYVFAREIDEHKLVAANFLGLAEIRIAAGDTPSAVELLRRLVVVVGNPFENLDPAAALLEKTGHNAEAIEFLEQLVKSSPWEAAYRLRLAKAKIAAGQDASAAQDALVAIASSTESFYSIRTQAAIALVGIQHQVELGSKELNLLARGESEMSVSAADQPFFYEARLRAAQTASDARLKVQLLANALADTPARDDARIPLFLAAASVKSDEFARGAVEPLLRQQLFSRVVPIAHDDEEIIGSDESDVEQAEQPGEASARLKLPIAQQAQVAWTLSEVLTRLDRLNEALSYLQTARRLEKAPARREQIGRAITDVRARVRRQQLNAARQPILHEALEQDRLVRPRLLARVAPPAKPSSQTTKAPPQEGVKQ